MPLFSYARDYTSAIPPITMMCANPSDDESGVKTRRALSSR